MCAATGQSQGVAQLTQHYMRLLVPGLFGSAVSFALQKFLQVQAITMPPAFAAAVAAVVHAPLNWLLIYWMDLGLSGAAIATSISQLLTPAVLLLVMNGHCGEHIGKWLLPTSEVLEGPTRDTYLKCWDGWRQVLSLRT